MGADFVFSWCDWPTDRDGVLLPDDKTTVALVQQRLARRAGEPQHLAALEEWGVYIEDDEALTEWLEGAYTQIKNLFGGGWVREVSGICVGGKRGIITGGMSWGDDPTDYYSIIGIINDLNVTKERF